MSDAVHDATGARATSGFDAELVRVQRNPWILSLAASPALLGIWTLAHAADRYDRGPVFALFGIAVAFMLLAWRKNPLARRTAQRVRTDAHTLHVGDERVPRAALKEGLVLPSGGGASAVLKRRGVAAPIVLEASGTAEARSLLTSLGFDATQSVAHFWTLGRTAASWTRKMLALLPALGPLVALLAFKSGPAGHASMGIFFAGILVTLALSFVPGRVVVGADGIELRWFGWRRFVAHRDIVVVTSYVEGSGRYKTCGITLVLESGENLRIPVDSGAESANLGMLLERIGETRQPAVQEAGELDPSLIARGSRDVAGWIAMLRTLGTGANAGMRTAPVPRERLWRIVEDPAGKAAERAAAAVALAADREEGAHARLRVAAAATAAPKLRVAIEAAAGDDDEAMREALGELEAEHAERQDV